MSRRNGGIIGPTNTPVGGLFKGVAGGVWRMNDVLTFVSNNQWPSGPQSIDNSCRFDDGSSDNLSLSVSGTSQSTTGTISFWFKRSVLSADQRVFTNYVDSNNYGGIKLQSDDKMEIVVVDGGSVTGKLVTTQVFRDTSAWYHCVVAIDSSNGTAGDRMRLYINGSEVTTFDTDTNPSSSATMEFFTDGTNRIGQFNSSQYFDGYLAEFVMIHGQQLTPSSFGETDSTTGIWKPKQIGSFTSAGDKSFYLDFKDSSNLGNDASGLNNDFTVNNLTSIDQSADTCVENFCTQHPLSYRSGQTVPTFSEGNLKVVFAASVNTFSYGTLGVQAGKWYWEVKVTFGSNVYTGIGFDSAATNTDINGYLLRQTGQKYDTSGSASSYASALSTGDTVMVAFDADNGTLWFGVNGTWSNSATQSEIENGTTSNSAFSSIDMSSIWLPLSKGGTSSNSNIQANFGNPIYSISSGNSDANGHGNFEYSVPSGYYALNTSNLNTYG